MEKPQRFVLKKLKLEKDVIKGGTEDLTWFLGNAILELILECLIFGIVIYFDIA